MRLDSNWGSLLSEATALPLRLSHCPTFTFVAPLTITFVNYGNVRFDLNVSYHLLYLLLLLLHSTLC